MLRKLILTVTLTLSSICASAALVDDARRMYSEGDYTGAAETARSILKSKPGDGNANYLLGAALMKLGNLGDAVPYLQKAESRNIGEASEMLVSHAISVYDCDAAQKYLDTWEKNFKKAKKTLPDSHSRLSSQLVLLRNMLERVEKIEILDSLSVDSARFFEVYRLSQQAGRILPPDAVSRIGAGANVFSTAYMPENNSEIIWGASDDNGRFTLYEAGILDDGTLDHQEAIDLGLDEIENARYPFLMPDGVTMYYSADGGNSLGGYDIFMTRRNDDGSYFKGQNIGMPFNSPANDYLLAIDETSGLGWWATDRNSPAGKITVYIYAPSQMRVNVEPDNPALKALAMLSDISLTRNPGTDYQAKLASMMPSAERQESLQGGKNRFELDMGNGKIYTALSDFRSDQAKSTMLEYLAAASDLKKHIAQENAMREKYRSGDHSISGDIIASEKETEALRARMSTLLNAAIRLETK